MPKIHIESPETVSRLQAVAEAQIVKIKREVKRKLIAAGYPVKGKLETVKGQHLFGVNFELYGFPIAGHFSHRWYMTTNDGLPLIQFRVSRYLCQANTVRTKVDGTFDADKVVEIIQRVVDAEESQEQFTKRRDSEKADLVKYLAELGVRQEQMGTFLFDSFKIPGGTARIEHGDLQFRFSVPLTDREKLPQIIEAIRAIFPEPAEFVG